MDYGPSEHEPKLSICQNCHRAFVGDSDICDDCAGEMSEAEHALFEAAGQRIKQIKECEQRGEYERAQEMLDELFASGGLGEQVREFLDELRRQAKRGEN